MLLVLVGHVIVFFVAAFGGYLWMKFRNNWTSAILTFSALGVGGYFLGWWVLISYLAGGYKGQRVAMFERIRIMEEQGISHPFYDDLKRRL